MPSFLGRLRTPRLAAAPSSPVTGEVYYDTTTNKLFWWNGTTWVDATGGGGGGLVIAGIADGEVAMWDATTGAWVRSTKTGEIAKFADAGLLIGADANLFRGGPQSLETSGFFTGHAGVWGKAPVGSPTDPALAAYVGGDANDRFEVEGTGAVKWGPGNAALDTNLYRSAADTLKTDDAFQSASYVAANQGGANQAALGYTGASVGPGVAFGAANDVNLYRSAANVLKTDDSLDVAGTLTVGGAAIVPGLSLIHI